ncbi:DUF349 domain-containing protein [Chondrinema litorale]|uniref:DUF349 domain-containing protein n=1 Tax=Chondrinema litorale TaxID=2994555 RepID=UPI002542D208|nr:DUF349 domain-containing protein [Chondrinema litorale]UZR93212.1 DUF349 domain-containing protein [Chondrinema litorale]
MNEDKDPQKEGTENTEKSEELVNLEKNEKTDTEEKQEVSTETIAEETEVKEEVSAESETESVKEEVTSETQPAAEAETTEESDDSDDSEDDGTDIEEDEDHDDEDHEEEDFSVLTLDQILKLSSDLLNEDNIKKADRTMRKLREEVNHFYDSEKSEAILAYREQNNGSEEGFEYKRSKEIDTFFHNFKQHNIRRKEKYESIRKDREKNLEAKKAIIQEIKDITNTPDQKGGLAKIKSLQKKWKEIGAVPQPEAENLYNTYNALLDLYYDHKSIEYELKEIDRKKNLDAKLELCEKAEDLASQENINEAIKLLKHLHDEYKSIGPIPKEKSDEVWERFKGASDALYDKKREFAEGYKKQLNENMKAKQELCLAVEPYTNFDSDRIKEWNEKTKELLEVQKKWEAIGPLPREVAKNINKQFWGNFKTFFNNKGKFFERLEEQRKENLKLKEELCVQAEELQESTEWNSAADSLKSLQKKWKELGPVPEAQRESVYKRFKAACDHFFERKRNKRSSQDKEFKENLKAKQDVCKKITDLAEANSDDTEQLNKLVDEYLAIGFVPKRDINNILEDFIAAFELFYENYPEEDEDKKEKIKLQAHMDFYEKAPQLGSKMRRQEQAIRKKIDALENDIALWENNLSFFANSKTADKLKKEFSTKIDQANKKLDDLRAQLRIISKIT